LSNPVKSVTYGACRSVTHFRSVPDPFG